MKNKYDIKVSDNELSWLGIDLDKTIAQGVWPSAGIGKFDESWRKAITQAHKKGYKIVIYTARASGDYKAIKEWCRDNKIPFDQIITGKPLFKMTFDDRDSCYDKNKAILEMLSLPKL